MYELCIANLCGTNDNSCQNIYESVKCDKSLFIGCKLYFLLTVMFTNRLKLDLVGLDIRLLRPGGQRPGDLEKKPKN